MCANFYDIRTFGAVMTTFVKAALNCGQVRGPVQLGFARSVEPVVPQKVTITRVAITTEADAEKKGTEMGRKYIIPYGLYRCEGYISANLARKTTGFSDDDLSLLWETILNMFEHDHSAARGPANALLSLVYTLLSPPRRERQQWGQECKKSTALIGAVLFLPARRDLRRQYSYGQEPSE